MIILFRGQTRLSITFSLMCVKQVKMDFPSGPVVKNLPVNVEDTRDTGLIPESERSPGEGNGNPLPYSCLGNPMHRGAWWGYSSWGCKRVGYDLATKQTECSSDQLKLPPQYLAGCKNKNSPSTFKQINKIQWLSGQDFTCQSKFNPWSRMIPHASE